MVEVGGAADGAEDEADEAVAGAVEGRAAVTVGTEVTA